MGRVRFRLLTGFLWALLIALLALLVVTADAADPPPPLTAPANPHIGKVDTVTYYVGWSQTSNAKLVILTRHYDNDPNDNRAAILAQIPGKQSGSYTVPIPAEQGVWYDIREIDWTDNDHIIERKTGPIRCLSFDHNGVCTNPAAAAAEEGA